MSKGHAIETALSYCAGMMYGVGLWLWIDATVYAALEDVAPVAWYHWLPIVVGTLALMAINLPPHEGIFGNPDMDLSGGMYRSRIRVWLLLSFALAFCCLIAAVWLSIAQLLSYKVDSKWSGVALIVSNILVFCSAIVYRVQRAFEVQDEAF